MKRHDIAFTICINLLLTSMLIGAFSVQPVNAYGDDVWVCGELDCTVIYRPPYGKLYVYVDVCKVQGDGDPEQDWYFYQTRYSEGGMTIQSIPGMACGGQGEWASDYDWKTNYHAEIFYAAYGGDLRRPVAYDPTNTDGYTSSSYSASVDIGGDTGGVGGGFSWGITSPYSIPYIRVEDHSDLTYPNYRVGWVHQFNWLNDYCESAQNTHLSTPAFIIKTAQNEPSYVDAYFYASFAYYYWDWIIVPPGGLPVYTKIPVTQDFATGVFWIDGFYSGD